MSVRQREGDRSAISLKGLPHHLLPWQLNSQEWKRRNEGRETGKGGEENWMKNACLSVGEERTKGNGGKEARVARYFPFSGVLFVLQDGEYEG